MDQKISIKKRQITIFVAGLIVVAIGGFFLFVSKNGGSTKHSGSLASRLNKLYAATVSYVSVESQFRYLSVYDRLTGLDKSTKIGWVSDIHADRFKRRDINSGLMFPRKYSDYLPKVFDDLRKQGINTVIATGDNTNSGDDNYANSLAQIAREKHMDVIWVKGNHDNSKVMSTLGVTGSKYYYVDRGNTRIVVLDDVESDGNYLGAIDQEQSDWLRGALKTEKQVVVAMHIPIFNENNIEKIHDLHGGDYSDAGDLLERYVDLESILRKNGNVKMVISGHWHVPWQKEYNGISYYGEAALTRESYSGAYAVIDLKDCSVNYSFAK